MDSLRGECLRRQRVVKSLRTVSGLGITQREEEGSGVETGVLSRSPHLTRPGRWGWFSARGPHKAEIKASHGWTLSF